FAQLTKVGKCTTNLRQAFEALDQRGWAWIAQEIGREEGCPRFTVTGERLSEMEERLKQQDDFLNEMEERLKQQDDFLKKVEAAIPRLLEEDIGKLPATLASRAIHIELRRKTATERVEPLRLDRLDYEPLRRQAARWAADQA